MNYKNINLDESKKYYQQYYFLFVAYRIIMVMSTLENGLNSVFHIYFGRKYECFWYNRTCCSC